VPIETLVYTFVTVMYYAKYKEDLQRFIDHSPAHSKFKELR